MGDQDFASGLAGQADLLSVQGGLDPTDDVIEVFAAAAEIGVVHGVEHRRQPVVLQAQCIFGAESAVPDQGFDALTQFRVVEDQGMEVEEVADLLGECAVQAIAKLVQFVAGLGHRAIETVEFGVEVLDLDPLLGGVQRLGLANQRPAERGAA